MRLQALPFKTDLEQLGVYATGSPAFEPWQVPGSTYHGFPAAPKLRDVEAREPILQIRRMHDLFSSVELTCPTVLYT